MDIDRTAEADDSARGDGTAEVDASARGDRSPQPGPGTSERAARRSPLGLAVLGLLFGGPLHPYRMQRLLKEWGKDQVINVGQRSSLYKTIRRLEERGLIAVHQTERDRQYPERTVYELTAAGREAAMTWLTEMIAVPHNEYPAFPAALSFLMLLGPDGAREALQRRHASVRDAVATLEAELTRYSSGLPRITLLEVEYQHAVATASLAWLERIIGELADGALSWSEADFEGASAAYELDDGGAGR